MINTEVVHDSLNSILDIYSLSSPIHWEQSNNVHVDFKWREDTSNIHRKKELRAFVEVRLYIGLIDTNATVE